ncbi:hypothetical protein BGZ75_003100 [Mortierella antarctica]|nr:hypothetical protein BGZ75_003100 [Mortierella antarctica]
MGYISGVAGLIIGSPLDVLKVRLQAQGDKTGAASHMASNKHSLSTMVQNEGIKSLFKGITSPIVGLAGLNSILFASYSASMRMLGTLSPRPSSTDPSTFYASAGEAFQPLSHVFTAGFVAGVACFLVSTPTELVKCRAQVIASRLDPSSSAAVQRAILSESGSWQVTKDVVRRFGFKGLYQGGWVTILRDAPGYGVYFLSYEGLKRALEIPPGETGDVIKTRLQTQPHLITTDPFSTTRTLPIANSGLTPTATTGLLSKSHVDARGLVHQTSRQGHSQVPAVAPYKGMIDCAIRSYKSEGMGVFMRGATPALLRAFPVNAVTFFVYELVMAELQKLE